MQGRVYADGLQYWYADCMPQFKSLVHGPIIKLKRNAIACMHHMIDTMHV